MLKIAFYFRSCERNFELENIYSIEQTRLLYLSDPSVCFVVDDLRNGKIFSFQYPAPHHNVLWYVCTNDRVAFDIDQWFRAILGFCLQAYSSEVSQIYNLERG